MSDFNLEIFFEGKSSTIARDLKLNLKKLCEESSLTPQESTLALLATATSVEHLGLANFAKEKLVSLGMAQEHIQEAAESAAIMAMLNMYYRFRHMVSHGEGGNTTDYLQAGLRMTSLAKPALGKDQFEMLSFAVSVLNGCENCIRSHEKALKDHGISAEKIHDLARLASVVKGVKALSIA